MRTIQYFRKVELPRSVQNFTNNAYKEEFVSIAFKHCLAVLIYKRDRALADIAGIFASLRKKYLVTASLDGLENDTPGQVKLFSGVFQAFADAITNQQWFGTVNAQRLTHQYSLEELVNHIFLRRVDEQAIAYIYIDQTLNKFFKG